MTDQTLDEILGHRIIDVCKLKVRGGRVTLAEFGRKTPLGLGRIVLRLAKEEVWDVELRTAIIGLLDALFEDADIEALETVCGRGLRAAVLDAKVALRDPEALAEMEARQAIEEPVIALLPEDSR